jgi:hypothetical protein
MNIKFLPLESQSKVKRKKEIKEELIMILEYKISKIIKVISKTNKILVCFENLKFLIKKVLPFYKKVNLKKILQTLRRNRYGYKTQFQLLILLLLLKNCATILSQYIGLILRRNFSEQNNFLRFLKILTNLLNMEFFSQVLGLKIIIKGKINGNMRKKKRIIKSKNTPLQTIKNTIDFSSINSTTRYGVFGIKV